MVKDDLLKVKNIILYVTEGVGLKTSDQNWGKKSEMTYSLEGNE